MNHKNHKEISVTYMWTAKPGKMEELLEIANPGPFYFCGDVPDEIVQAAAGMGLDATFAARAFGFSR